MDEKTKKQIDQTIRRLRAWKKGEELECLVSRGGDYKWRSPREISDIHPHNRVRKKKIPPTPPTMEKVCQIAGAGKLVKCERTNRSFKIIEIAQNTIKIASDAETRTVTYKQIINYLVCDEPVCDTVWEDI